MLAHLIIAVALMAPGAGSTAAASPAAIVCSMVSRAVDFGVAPGSGRPAAGRLARIGPIRLVLPARSPLQSLITQLRQ
jgi:hypothetical protein